MATSYDLGAVSTYALAVQYGFVGTIADWVQAIVSASETYDTLVEQIESLELNIPLLDSTLSYNDRAANAYSVGEYLRRLETLISTPLASSTVAGMTDTTKVYVYTGSETGYTAGNWYYYNGTAWVSGGVYNAVSISTDTTLTIAGSAADAKKVGDELTDIKQDLSDISNGRDINLFDESALIDGYVYRGVVGGVGSGWTHTPKIAVNKFDGVFVALTNGSDLNCCNTYDEDGNFIDSITAGSQYRRLPYSFYILSENVKYIDYNVFPPSVLPYDQQYLNVQKGRYLTEDINRIFDYFPSATDIILVPGNIGDYDYATDIDNFPNMTIIGVGDSVLSSIAHVPSKLTHGFTVVTYSAFHNNISTGVQIAVEYLTGTIATRTNTGTWSDWNYIELKNSFTVGASGSDFTTLKACTEYIVNNAIEGATVFVKSGTYDLVVEYGQSYLDNISQSTNKGIGLHVGNNTHFIFAEGAKVVFNYTGANTDCGEYFSPFNIIGSVILENAVIECSNCRYCVHEDLPTSADSIPNETTVKYINCVMKNSGGSIGYEAPACIGAGTNKNTLSIIDGGVYDSVWDYDISYHNYTGSYPSRIVCSNAWMKKGIRFGDFGTSLVDVEINGCRMSKNIYRQSTTYFSLKSWNNTIESN